MAAPRWEKTLRGPVSVVLIVLATVLALAGGVALYMREEIINSDAFADRASDALQRDAVRRVVAREVVVQLVDRGSTDLISARPVLESVAEFVIRSEPFRRVFRSAAVNGHRLLFVREGGNAAFDVADAGTVVASTLRSVAPKVARQIPKDADAQLIKLKKRSFATGTLRFADHVRVLGFVLLPVAIAMYAIAVFLAPDRRRAVTRLGVALGVAGAALAIGLIVLRSWVLHHVYGSEELTNGDVRGAIGGIWDAYLGDLLVWALIVGALALLVAAASDSLLKPFSAGAGVARLRRLVRPPAAPAWRTLHGGVLLALGVFIVLQPTLALQVVAVAGGALILYFGASEVLSAVYSPSQHEEAVAARAAHRRGWAIAGVTVVAAAILGTVLVLVLGGGGGPAQGATAVRTCNGYAALCDRRLDQVAFAGAHNAMSAADSPGWLLANQRRDVERQLSDGIRLFLIDPHYGVEDGGGKVRTDFRAELPGLNRVGSKLSPQAQAALERVGGRLGFGEFRGGKPDVWLCHSVCELGATKMVTFLGTIRQFLDRNPGEVVIIFDEDYVKERDLERVYRESGLFHYLATLNRDEPLPTLRQLIRSGKRVLVFTEREPSGQYAWNMEGFAYVQDTPLGAKKPSELQCARSRGSADSPLLMLNNWIDRFPPPLSANRAVLRRSFIVGRARRCRRERKMLPNLIASDFYDQGHLVDAVRQLNGFGDRPPAPVKPLADRPN